MKYFTPERYVTLQDFTSDAAMDAADAQWQQAAARYEAYYRSVSALLPAEYRRLQQDYDLHDAQVLYLGRRGSTFAIALRLDPPPQQVLEIGYELITDAPLIRRDVLPASLREQGGASWLYDEVELLAPSPPECVHSIFLSNGWEVRLPFRALHVTELEALLPAPRNGRPTGEVLPEPETV